MAFVPNLTLNTVEDYITDARTLLQDQVAPFRYDDPSLLTAFNTALLEGRRLRPDLFVYKNDGTVPYFATVNTAPVGIEEQFRLAFVFGLCAHALARDQDDYQDVRSSTFMSVFNSMLMGLSTPPIGGGTPAGSN